VAKLADAHGLGPCGETLGGSSPLPGTMISAIQKEENGTITLTITVSSGDVKKTWDEVVDEAVKTTELPGFRVGKSPRHLVEEKLDKAKIREAVLKKLLPRYYVDAVQEHNLKPIMNPKIHVDPNVISADKSKDWQFTATTCEMPEVKLGNYKQGVQEITAKSKIVVPGRERQEAKLDDITKALLENVDTKIPQILIDQEIDRLLSQTLDDVKRLGLTLDQYLSSTGKTPETLRNSYKHKVENDLTLEFALQKIAGEEKISVEEKEIEEAIQKAKDENERKHLESNRYLLANVLRQQKTLDFLKNL
jgi:FKBP-type peptidyl-prolyl cis-trans isomerase (trigger factor)